MITILTATYNRAYCLPELYESIKQQSSLNFEWVIVDDGSSDGTDELVKQWIDEGLLLIKYVNQVNSGKHLALNYGVDNSSAEWIFIVDSDDKITTDAISSIEQQIGLLPATYSGLCFRKANFKSELLGSAFDATEEYIDCHPTDAASIFIADLAYVFKKTVMQQNSFPSISGEKFVPELLIWNAIGDTGPIRYFLHTIIYLCEYLPDGLSCNFKSQLRKNPKGFSLFYKDQMRREKKITKKNKKWY